VPRLRQGVFKNASSRQSGDQKDEGAEKEKPANREGFLFFSPDPEQTLRLVRGLLFCEDGLNGTRG
jgi:hypothetical protein